MRSVVGLLPMCAVSMVEKYQREAVMKHGASDVMPYPVEDEELIRRVTALLEPGGVDRVAEQHRQRAEESAGDAPARSFWSRLFGS